MDWYLKINDIFLSLRNKKDEFFKPVVEYTPKWITPNLISTARLLITLILFYIWASIKNQPFYSLKAGAAFGILLILIGIITDLWDGALARYYKQYTFWGSVYDSMIDKIFILPITLISLTVWPFMLRTIIFLFCFKVLLLIFILIKTFFYSNLPTFKLLQKYYFFFYALGYFGFVMIFLIDLSSYYSL